MTKFIEKSEKEKRLDYRHKLQYWEFLSDFIGDKVGNKIKRRPRLE